MVPGLARNTSFKVAALLDALPGPALLAKAALGMLGFSILCIFYPTHILPGPAGTDGPCTKTNKLWQRALQKGSARGSYFKQDSPHSPFPEDEIGSIVFWQAGGRMGETTRHYANANGKPKTHTHVYIAPSVTFCARSHRHGRGTSKS